MRSHKQESVTVMQSGDIDVPLNPELRLPEPGECVGDKYVVTQRIGEGGMGVVFEGVDLRSGKPVALKFLHPASSQCAESCHRFEREARAMGQLRSAHAVHVLDVDKSPAGIPYMVMDRLEGSDLELEFQRRTTPFPIAEAVGYVSQACSAMAEAHALGIVHRDLKPSNLFLCCDDDRGVTVKVLDFGISKWLVDPAHVTSTFISMGTPLYMSPEQVRSAKYVDSRSDIWSLGVILYELLAGEPPFSGTPTAVIAGVVADAVPSLRARRPDVPEALEAVVLRALQKDPEQRFADVRAMADALAPFLNPMFTTPMPSPAVLVATYDASDSGSDVAMRRAPRTERMENEQPVEAVAFPARVGTPLATKLWRMPRTIRTKKRGTALVGCALLAIPLLALTGWARPHGPFGARGEASAATVREPSAPRDTAEYDRDVPANGATGESDVRAVRATMVDAAPARVRVPTSAEGPADGSRRNAPASGGNPLYL